MVFYVLIGLYFVFHVFFFFFSSRRRHTRSKRDWSSDVCSSDLLVILAPIHLQTASRVALRACNSNIMTDVAIGEPAFRASAESAVVCSLRDAAAIRIEGDEAREFLQNQLSSDVAALPAGRSHWSSYNSAKGRVIATMRLWCDNGGFGAIVASDLAASTAKRLSMFVLRAKARISDQSAARAVLGVAGPQAVPVLARVLGVPPDVDAAMAIERAGATVVGLGDGRFVVVCDAAEVGRLRADIVKRATPADENVWHWLSINAGIPTITAATTDQFVPQMLNWDALDGISFQKGCYPGQEIVARMRYLGRLKERLYGFRAAAESQPEPGVRLYSPTFGATPCGTVINAAAAPGGGHA